MKNTHNENILGKIKTVQQFQIMVSTRATLDFIDVKECDQEGTG